VLIEWTHRLLVLFLIVVFPIWDCYEARRLRAAPASEGRIRLYRITIAWLWLATAVLFLTVPLAELDEPPKAWTPRPAIVAGIVLGGLVALLAPVLAAYRGPEARDRALRALQPVAFMLPQSGREKLYFLAVAMSAAICEEVIFRGFLIRYFDERAGLLLAVVGAAAVFGLDHTYQGWKGVFATAGVGLVFTFLFIAVSSLWLPMLCHALLDLRVLALVSMRSAARG
jgi:membrane protease YdiL (CAAX protease family)